MGSAYGVRLEYNPFWEEREDLSEKEQLYHMGYEDGYSKGTRYFEENEIDIKKLRKQNEALHGLLEANVRVIRAELKKELQEEADARLVESSCTDEARNTSTDVPA